jgi:hypothetical protein
VSVPLLDDNITPEKQRGPGRRHTYTEIENQLKNMEEDMMYKTKSDSTITYKEIKKAIFDLKKGKSAGPDRILNEVIVGEIYIELKMVWPSKHLCLTCLTGKLDTSTRG